MANHKAIKLAILKACDPMRPRWMRELGVDLERMVVQVEEAKKMKRSANLIASMQGDVDSLVSQIME